MMCEAQKLAAPQASWAEFSCVCFILDKETFITTEKRWNDTEPTWTQLVV